MTEAEWLACTDPRSMLDFVLAWANPPGLRKRRLFAVAMHRRRYAMHPPFLPPRTDTRALTLLDTAERFLEGLASPAEYLEAYSASGEEGEPFTFLDGRTTPRPAYMSPEARQDEATERYEVATVREVFGNPFHLVALSRTWQTPTAVALAQAAYDNRTLPAGTLDSARLAVLADALEEAGCSAPDLLNHLRGPGPHVRGCWVVDLLLGKE
jgi:hypothetical protein